jgi:ribonuclease HI
MGGVRLGGFAAVLFLTTALWGVLPTQPACQSFASDPHTTNNRAEFSGAILGLKAAATLLSEFPLLRLRVEGDSRLVSHHLLDRNVIHDADLQLLAREAVHLLRLFYEPEI